MRQGDACSGCRETFRRGVAERRVDHDDDESRLAEIEIFVS